MKTLKLTVVAIGMLSLAGSASAQTATTQTNTTTTADKQKTTDKQKVTDKAKVKPEQDALRQLLPVISAEEVRQMIDSIPDVEQATADAKAAIEQLRAEMPMVAMNAQMEAAGAMKLLTEVQASGAFDRGFGSGFGFGSGNQSDREREREQSLYERGYRAISERQYDRAVQAFQEVAAMKATKADAALYWTAWALNRQGNRTEALSTLEKLRKEYAKSQWIDDAKVLEAEIKQRGGQPLQPDQQQDEDIKLMAINALMNADPDRAVPMLEKLLQGTDSPRLKQRALFVLAQSNSPAARQVIADVARGNRNPDLQDRAVQYLGVQGGSTSRQLLADIYKSSQNVDVKKRILRAFMTSGDRERLFAAAKEESNPELRREAIRQLGAMNAQEELWQLYQNESDVENRRAVIRSMMASNAVDRLIQIAQQEKEPSLRKTAIQNLSAMGSRNPRTGDTLIGIYTSDKDPEIRKLVINGLFVQNNAKALVDLARKETDPEMKRQIVSKLANMKAKEATDYMLELLSK